MSRLLRGIRASVSIKLLVVSELLLLFTIALLMLRVLPEMRSQIVTDIQNRLLAIANTTALSLDGEALRTIREPADARTPAFSALKLQLKRVQAVNNLTDDNIYTFYIDPASAGRVRFGVMTHPSPFVGDPYPMRDKMLPVFANGRSEVTELYRDEYGQWISAYAPILDSRGAVVGLLDVNEKADAYFAGYHAVLRTVWYLGVGVLVASSLLGWVIVTNLVVRPMRAVENGMQALRRSEFNHRVNLQTGDEFQRLGDTFNRLARELNAARSVQASFAPKDIPSRHGWRIAAVSEPCEATAGDYVDAFDLPGDRIGVVVADVTGHGLAPALLMSACRSALRAMSALDASPARIVDRLDAMLSADLTEGRFITLLFGVLHSDGRFTYCNAGHGPALILSDQGAAPLAAHRPPVGINWQSEDGQGETTILLKSHDRLLLASDGVTEAWSESNQQFGEDRLIEAVGDRSLDTNQTVQRLLSAVAAHRGRREPSDDLTILCIDRE